MKKYYSLVFPFGLIILIPRTLLLFVIISFILVSLAYLIGYKLIKKDNFISSYKENILKIFIIGLIVDIAGFLDLSLPRLLSGNEFINNNLVLPILYNPFSNVISLIYISIIIILSGYLIYLANKMFVFEKLNFDKKESNTLAIIIALLTAPYLMLIPTTLFYPKSTYETLELSQYANTYIGDNSRVGYIISKLGVSKYYDSFSLKTDKEPYELSIYLKDDTEILFNYTLEKDASVLFNLISNVSVVNFYIKDKVTVYKIDKINTIYDNVRSISLDDIYKRYSTENFSYYSYLGHSKGYDFFDKSDYCGETLEKIYEDSNYIYSVKCVTVENIVIVKDGKETILANALKDNTISLEDLEKTNMTIYKGAK